MNYNKWINMVKLLDKLIFKETKIKIRKFSSKLSKIIGPSKKIIKSIKDKIKEKRKLISDENEPEEVRKLKNEKFELIGELQLESGQTA